VAEERGGGKIQSETKKKEGINAHSFLDSISSGRTSCRYSGASDYQLFEARA